MKAILLWDPRFPDRAPVRLSVDDTVASAAVRAGVAAAADPSQSGALNAGGAIDPGMLTEVVLMHGANGGATRRVFLPYSVVLVGAVAGVLASIGTPIPATVSPVALNLALFGAATDWTPGIGVIRTAAGQFAPTLEAADQLAAFRSTAIVQTYYVDSVAGVTTNAGTQASPWLNIGTAAGQTPAADTIEILVTPPANRILFGSRGSLNTTTILRNLIVRAIDDLELIFSNAAGLLTWTDNGDGTFTGSSGVTATLFSPPTDWSSQSRAEHPKGLGRTFTLTTGSTAANDATIRAGLQPGQAYKTSAVGTNDITIRPFGNRALSVWQNYLVPPAANGNVIQLRATDAGSASPFFFFRQALCSGGASFTFQNFRTSTGGRGRVVLDRCASVGTAYAPNTASANAMSGIGAWLIQDYDFKVDAAGSDALNIHNGVVGGNSSTYVSGDCWAVHVRPTVIFAGVSNSGSDNNETGHENCRAMSIMPTYLSSNGATIGYIDTAQFAVFGGQIGPSIRTDAQGHSETVGANSAGACKGVLVECTITGVSPGSYDLQAIAPASLNCFGMTKGALRTNGNVNFLPMPA